MGLPVAASRIVGRLAAGDLKDCTPAEIRTLLNIADGADVSIGRHTLWVPAAAMRPTFTAGCNSLAIAETTAGNPDMQSLDFDPDAVEHAQFSIAFPTSWNLGTITYKVFWTHPSTATNYGVAWHLKGVAVSNDGTLDVAFGTAVEVDDVGGTTEDLYVSAESGNLTIAGTPADNDLCIFDFSRDATDGVNDTLAVNAQLLGIQIFYTTDTGVDS